MLFEPTSSTAKTLEATAVLARHLAHHPLPNNALTAGFPMSPEHKGLGVLEGTRQPSFPET